MAENQREAVAACALRGLVRRPSVCLVSSPEAILEADQALVLAVSRNDAGAMAAFYDRFSGLVMAVAMRMLRDRTDAEELAEDVFVELWRRSAHYEASRGSVATWIATITRSRGIDRLRKRQRQQAREWGDAATEQASVVDDPLASVALTEERSHVREHLDGLQLEQRQALELAYFEGLSHSEVATRLSRPLGTVKSHIRQGLIRLRGVLRTPDSRAP